MITFYSLLAKGIDKLNLENILTQINMEHARYSANHPYSNTEKEEINATALLLFFSSSVFGS